MAFSRKQRHACTGFGALLLGLALLDRSFAAWRNDPRNIPNANGVYPTAADFSVPLKPAPRSWVLELMAASGTAMVILSVVLLGKEPI